MHFVYAQTDQLLVGSDDDFLSVLNVFGELSQYLKALKTLPLELNDIWAVDPALRGCAVRVPDSSRPLELLIQFVNSSAWPDNVEAVRKLYHSFRLKMATEIRVGACVVQHDCLDVHYKGYMFRIRIYLSKELMLLRNARLASELRLAGHARAVHASAVGGFQMRHNTFGNAVRLCKRWLHAHLLSGHLMDEFVELTVLYVYSHPHPYPRVPTNAMFAFFRWLRLLATFDWSSQPLLVSINGDMLDGNTARANMDPARSVIPFVVSEFDMTSQWTRSHPSPTMWNRTVALARHAQSRVLPDPLIVFGHNYSEYDVILHVDPAATASMVEENGELLVGFEPVKRLVVDLQARFSRLAMFLYDEDGGTRIGVVFYPGVLQPRTGDDVQSNLIATDPLCVAPTAGNSLQFDFGQFERTVLRIGDGIISSVERKE
jgi:hypothetical protein